MIPHHQRGIGSTSHWLGPHLPFQTQARTPYILEPRTTLARSGSLKPANWSPPRLHENSGPSHPHPASQRYHLVKQGSYETITTNHTTASLARSPKFHLIRIRAASAHNQINLITDRAPQQCIPLSWGSLIASYSSLLPSKSFVPSLVRLRWRLSDWDLGYWHFPTLCNTDGPEAPRARATIICQLRRML